MPRPSEATKELFRSLLPDDPRVQVKPMFGQLAGFTNGHMFAGIFGEEIHVRLGDADRAVLLAEPGARVFAPMEGRPMRAYVVLPGAWRGDPARMREWVDRALATTATLPPKAAAKGKKR